MHIDAAALRARLASVRDRIARAAGRVGRDPSSVRLVAVSKTFTPDHVRAIADCGQFDFGENKVQEALAKMDATADLPIVWHLVGHLQSNKARKAGARFDVVHSVDDHAIAARLDEAALAGGRTIRLLVQVDLAREPTKHGVEPAGLLPLFNAAQPLAAARMVGLMAIPPATDDPEHVRPYFRALREISEGLVADGVDRAALGELSMGMSDDFEVAIEEGASLIRVGTAIFGSRTYV